MKLSLSTRIAESSSRKDVAEMPIEALAPLARVAGFEGLSMRASVVSVGSPQNRVDAVRAALERENLAVSMVMGDIPLATNSPEAPLALRNITPYLDLAANLGGRLVRVMMHGDDDIGHAQRAADEANERGMTLAHQTHWGTLCETVEGTLETARRVGRQNFGITFEPANLLACGEAHDSEAITRLAPHLVNVYFQNVRLDPDGPHVFKTRARGPVPLSYVPLDDPGGLSARDMVSALAKVGYNGWVSVHQPLRDGQTVEDAIAEAAAVFHPLVANP
ncbi:MAG: sugar phosphate isomerase/epimerase [Alphaproteobacteria bacterium]|nr:sugar phosphate isomerase/epimerase [Alphaproteobacteria bacterium]